MSNNTRYYYEVVIYIQFVLRVQRFMKSHCRSSGFLPSSGVTACQVVFCKASETGLAEPSKQIEIG